MKKTLLLVGGLFAFTATFSQTTIFSEDFETGAGGFTLNTADQGGVTGTSGDNFWVANNVYAGGTGNVLYCALAIGQPFTVGATPAQPAGISNANGGYLHIVAEEAYDNGILNANYGPAENTFCIFTASHFASMTNDINTTNFTGVTLDFWWLNLADVTAVGELWYSTNGGTTWTQKTGTTYQGVNTWTNTNLTDPAWDAQAQLRFGWRFNNGASLAGSDPAFSIDDFEITGTLATACTNTTSSFSETACFSYTVPSGDETYSTPGTQTVMDTILNAAGCDSIMTIAVTINSVDVAVNNATGQLSANSSTGTYQWIDCADPGNVISGETNQLFTPSLSGSYAVIVTDNGCTDTSTCYNSGPSSISEYDHSFEVYPNPSSGQVSINTSKLNGSQVLTIMDINGRLIINKIIAGNSIVELDLELELGTYFISLTNEEGERRIQRLIIN